MHDLNVFLQRKYAQASWYATTNGFVFQDGIIRGFPADDTQSALGACQAVVDYIVTTGAEHVRIEIALADNHIAAFADSKDLACTPAT